MHGCGCGEAGGNCKLGTHCALRLGIAARSGCHVLTWPAARLHMQLLCSLHGWASCCSWSYAHGCAVGAMGAIGPEGMAKPSFVQVLTVFFSTRPCSGLYGGHGPGGLAGCACRTADMSCRNNLGHACHVCHSPCDARRQDPAYCFLGDNQLQHTVHFFRSYVFPGHCRPPPNCTSSSSWLQLSHCLP
jgi:hypothetical protein